MLLEQGLNLMLFGMGTVFVFLALLVVVTTLMSSLITRYFPEVQPAPKVRVGAKPAGATMAEDPRLVAAIGAAIHQHRERHK